MIPLLVSALFPFHDLSDLYPPNPPRGSDLVSRLVTLFDDVGMGLDFIDFFMSVCLMPLSRGLLRIGRGKPDFGLHIIYLPWTAVHQTDDNEHLLRRYHVQVRHVCASSRGYWLAVGSHQARWTIEILTRARSGRAPRPWDDRPRP